MEIATSILIVKVVKQSITSRCSIDESEMPFKR